MKFHLIVLINITQMCFHEHMRIVFTEERKKGNRVYCPAVAYLLL